MPSRSSDRSVSRRAVLRGLTTGLVGSCGLGSSSFTLGGQRGEEGGSAEKTTAEIHQVTKEEHNHSNIYCEVPYCSRSSHYFLYARKNPRLSVNTTELRVVELGTWKDERLDVALSIEGSAISHDGVFYYLKRSGKGDLDLVRTDLDERKPEVIYRRKDEPWVRSLGTISPDRRYFAGGVRVKDDWSRFGILLVDLENATEALIDEDPYILNPHPQFDPGEVCRLMIQHNRGGRFTPGGKLERLVGPEGATLYLLSVPDGRRTELQVGRPFTTPCTGHEAWIGRSGSMLLTVAGSGDYAPERGNLLSIRPGEAAKTVSPGYQFNHVGVSRCGKYFSCDDWRPPYRLVVGSIETGHSAVICESRTTPGRSQNTHPHAYLTPDLKWLVFNSNRTGFAHIHAARIPVGLLDALAEAERQRRRR